MRDQGRQDLVSIAPLGFQEAPASREEDLLQRKGIIIKKIGHLTEQQVDRVLSHLSF